MGVLPFDLRLRTVPSERRRLLGGYPKAVMGLARFAVDDLGVDLTPVGIGVDVDVFALEIERFGQDLAAFTTVDGNETIGTQLCQRKAAAVLEGNVQYPV